MAVSQHALHVQILDAAGVEPARGICCEPVLCILADVADTRVQPCQLHLGFPAIGRAFFLAAQTAGQALLALEQCLVWLGAGNGGLSCQECCESGYT